MDALPDGAALWILVAALAVVLNAVPAFMPPTWALLAYFHIKYGLDLVPLVAVGAGAAGGGRWVLAESSKTFGLRFVPRAWRANIEALVAAIRSHRMLSLSSLALFAIGPIPSNHLCIAAGLARVPLQPVLATFGLARFLSYVLWVAAAETATNSLQHLLTPSLGSGLSAAAQVVGFVVLVLVMRVNWANVLKERFDHGRKDGPHDPGTPEDADGHGQRRVPARPRIEATVG